MKYSENRFAICYRPIAEPKTRLFCFPSAGAGASQYNKWFGRVPAGVEVWSIQLPGREHLFQAAKPADVMALAELICSDITPLFTLPFYFYGHSYGSVVGYEIVQQLQKKQLPMPNKLLIGARRAPHLGYDELSANLSDASLIQSLDKFGGIPEILKKDQELLAFYLKTIRYDLQLNETYIANTQQPIDIPIHAFYGTEDTFVTAEQIYAWQGTTRAAFAATEVNGGHFFLTDADSEFYNYLKNQLNDSNNQPASGHLEEELIAY